MDTKQAVSSAGAVSGRQNNPPMPCVVFDNSSKVL